MKKSFKKVAATALVGVMTLAYTLGIAGTVSNAAVSKGAQEAAKKEYDKSGNTEYHAYFGFQMAGTWIFRDPWYSEELGLEGTKLEGNAYTDFLQSGDEGTTKVDGTVTDAIIKGNGTYSVKVEGINDILNTKAKEPGVNDPKISMMYVSTDIPVAARDAGFTISNVKVINDGMEVTGIPTDPYYPAEYEDKDISGNGNGGLIRFDPVNTYQKDQGDYPNGPDNVLLPTDSMEIQFEVSGMDVDNPDATVDDKKSDDSSSSSASSGSSSAGGASSSKDDGLEDTEHGIPGTTIAIAAVVVVVVIVVIVVAVNAAKKKDE